MHSLNTEISRCMSQRKGVLKAAEYSFNCKFFIFFFDINLVFWIHSESTPRFKCMLFRYFEYLISAWNASFGGWNKFKYMYRRIYRKTFLNNFWSSCCLLRLSIDTCRKRVSKCYQSKFFLLGPLSYKDIINILVTFSLMCLEVYFLKKSDVVMMS